MWLPVFLRRNVVDERFLMHRYKSTSHASVVAAVLMGGWVLYEALRNDVIRWDFLAVMAVMAVVKWGFMIWYRTRD